MTPQHVQCVHNSQLSHVCWLNLTDKPQMVNRCLAGPELRATFLHKISLTTQQEWMKVKTGGWKCRTKTHEPHKHYKEITRIQMSTKYSKTSQANNHQMCHAILITCIITYPIKQVVHLTSALHHGLLALQLFIPAYGL